MENRCPRCLSPISVLDGEIQSWAPKSLEGPPSHQIRPLNALYPVDSPRGDTLDASLLGGLHPLQPFGLLDVDSEFDSPAAVVAAARHLTLEAAVASCAARRNFAPTWVSLDAQSQHQVSSASEGWPRRRRMKRLQATGVASAGLTALGRHHSRWVDLLNGGQSFGTVVPNDESAHTRWGSFWACPPEGRPFRPRHYAQSTPPDLAIRGTAIAGHRAVPIGECPCF